MRPAALLALPVVASLALVACGSNTTSSSPPTSRGGTSSSASGASSSGAGSSTTTDNGVTAEGISAARCVQNKQAGKITYLSGFDFAASAGIAEVVVAKERGYFDKMCLDVDLKSSFSTANYPLVAAGRAEFASAGSY